MAQPIQLTDDQFRTLLGGYQQAAVGGGGTNGGSSKSSVKPVRPSVDENTTEGEWAVFEDNWLRFKRMANLTDVVDIRDNLRQCCSTSLNKRLFDVKGSSTLDSAVEVDLLAWIKDIAVKGVHKEVHRTQFVRLNQKQGQSLNSYYGCLKAEASLCDFRVAAPSRCADVACTCANHGVQVSYTNDMVAT